MDVLCRDVLQGIQDADASILLYLVYKSVRPPSQFKCAMARLQRDRLFRHSLRNIKGSHASVMFAYSSGDLEHLISTIPTVRFNSNNYKVRRLLVSGNYPYRVMMRFYKAVMYVKSIDHYVLLRGDNS